jgi:hypothetical protein
VPEEVPHTCFVEVSEALTALLKQQFVQSFLGGS